MTFWSGVLVMVFLCWAWRDSRKQASTVHKGRVMVSNVHSHVAMMYHLDEGEDEDAYEGWDWQFDRVRIPPVLLKSAFPKPVCRELDPENPLYPARHVMLPHWLMLLAVAMVWCGALVWRQRRLKRGGIAAADGSAGAV